MLTLALALGVGACASPEATRQRAGGSGGDVGNRGDTVRMHEGSDPYWNTPRTPGIEGTALDPARQAQRLSRP
ncbi:MAG: hypothetical protein FJ027_05200 [Candidatus Rokubacteria bacterium]|nr:hypothetical protein [Candidatus Rokubacteria bacterium]